MNFTKVNGFIPGVQHKTAKDLRGESRGQVPHREPTRRVSLARRHWRPSSSPLSGRSVQSADTLTIHQVPTCSIQTHGGTMTFG